jgi:hypothetical protein
LDVALNGRDDRDGDASGDQAYSMAVAPEPSAKNQRTVFVASISPGNLNGQ